MLCSAVNADYFIKVLNIKAFGMRIKKRLRNNLKLFKKLYILNYIICGPGIGPIGPNPGFIGPNPGII